MTEKLTDQEKDKFKAQIAPIIASSTAALAVAAAAAGLMKLVTTNYQKKSFTDFV